MGRLRIISPANIISHIRRIGSVLHVCVNGEVRACGGKRAYSAILLGYGEDDIDHAQKGYIVRRMKDGKIVTVAYSQVWKFYENYLAYV